jgi:DNA-directed RNA polymerase subunit RPC12/RpoP
MIAREIYFCTDCKKILGIAVKSGNKDEVFDDMFCTECYNKQSWE